MWGSNSGDALSRAHLGRQKRSFTASLLPYYLLNGLRQVFRSGFLCGDRFMAPRRCVSGHARRSLAARKPNWSLLCGRSLQLLVPHFVMFSHWLLARRGQMTALRLVQDRCSAWRSGLVYLQQISHGAGERGFPLFWSSLVDLPIASQLILAQAGRASARGRESFPLSVAACCSSLPLLIITGAPPCSEAAVFFRHVVAARAALYFMVEVTDPGPSVTQNQLVLVHGHFAQIRTWRRAAPTLGAGLGVGAFRRRLIDPAIGHGNRALCRERWQVRAPPSSSWSSAPNGRPLRKASASPSSGSRACLSSASFIRAPGRGPAATRYRCSSSLLPQAAALGWRSLHSIPSLRDSAGGRAAGLAALGALTLAIVAFFFPQCLASP